MTLPTTKAQDPDAYARLLVAETFKLIEGEGKINGALFVRTVVSRFLSIYISTWIDKVLRAKPKEPAGKKEEYDFVSSNFLKAKVNIQETISEGFQQALGEFSGQSVEYYCRVLPVPQPLNKRPI